MEISASELIAAATRARNEGRADDALRDVERAIALCRSNGDHPGLITSIKALGHLQADRKDFQASAETYRVALELARRNPDPIVLAHTVRHLGDALARLGETQRAEAAYTEALALHEAQLGAAEFHHANALRALARLLDSSNRPDEARVRWARARDLYASAGVQSGVMECAARLGA